VEHLKPVHFKSRFLGLPANITLGVKCMTGINNLAYFSRVPVTKKKSFNSSNTEPSVQINVTSKRHFAKKLVSGINLIKFYVAVI
jgi:hypothetical protein